MMVREFLQDLSAQGVELWLEGKRLRYRAPQGVLTPTLLSRLREHKQEVVALLRDAAPDREDGDGAGRVFPLSHGQRALWFLHQREPESPAYNLAFAARIRSLVDVAALRRTLRALVARHPSLRTTFTARGEEPVQEVHPEHEVSWKETFAEIDASGWSDDEFNRHLAEARQRPFDLQRGPVLRVNLFRRAERDHVLLLVIHHVACDGWSLWTLQDEFLRLYAGQLRTGEEISGGLSPLSSDENGTVPFLRAPAPQPYGDFVRWQSAMLAGHAGEEQAAYWQRQLGGEPPQLDLPTDRPRPAMHCYHGAAHAFHLGEDLSRQLRRLAQAEGVTLYMLLLAAFHVLLHRYCGQDDVLVGSPTTGRSQPQFAGVVGYFVNPVVMRASLSGNPAFKTFLGQVRDTVLGALAHQDYPFSLLVEQLKPNRDPGRLPLCEVMFVLQRPQQAGAAVDLLAPGTAPTRMNWGVLEIEPLAAAQQAGEFDLTMQIVDGDPSLRGTLQYNTDLFEAATIARMAGHFATLLQGIVADPDAPITALPLMDDAERRQVLVDFNATAAEFPRDVCVHELFESRAEKTPEALAVAEAGRRLSYGELNARANQLAHYLVARGVRCEIPVAICMERSAELIVGLLAILKAGGAYVPLDPSYPADRLAFMLSDSRAPLVLTTGMGGEATRGLSRFSRSENGTVPFGIASENGTFPFGTASEVIDVDADASQIARQSQENPGAGTTPENLAYVIYTSGSTGRPKGVAIPHVGLMNLVAWHWREYAVTAADRATQLAGVAFDAAVWELWPYLTAGASIHLPDEATRTTPERLVQWLAGERITLCFLPTPLAEAVLDERWPPGLALRVLLTGGDRLHRGSRQVLPFRLVNHYGPTENSVVTTSGEVERGAGCQPAPRLGPPPIGRPIANTCVYILDRQMNPQPVGVPGELCIAGVGLARGYWRRPELTAEKFLATGLAADGTSARLYRTGDLARWLPDGQVEFLGRLDQQVKIRGFRVELGEIESVLAEHAGVREAAVTVQEGAAKQPRLVAYVVPREGWSWSAEELRGFLKSRLPEYMVPSALVELASLPLTSHGKVDRRALPAVAEMPGERRAHVPPRTATEAALAAIWREVLHVEQVGVDDNFFELGGHSLLATSVVTRIRQVFEVELPLRRLFEETTLAKLALLVDQARGENAASPCPPMRPVDRTGELPLSFAQERLWFLDQLQPNSPLYNISVAVRIAGRLEVEALRQGLREIVARHEALRTTFAPGNRGPVQRIAPRLDLDLPLVRLDEMPEADRGDCPNFRVSDNGAVPSDGDSPIFADTKIGTVPLDARREAEVKRRTDAESQQPFDLAAGPLLRACLLRLDDTNHVFLLTMHHIVSDGWSMGVFVRELAALYEAFATGRRAVLPDLAIQYVDFAVWQREWLAGEVLADHLAYWRKQLAGIPPLELPTDRPRPPVQSFRGARHTFRLAQPLCDSLATLGQREGVTPFMVLLAAFQVLLHRYTGQDDLAVGSGVAGRNRAELEGLIGFFVNMLVIRGDLEGNPTFRECLGRVRRTSLDAFAHQDLPFDLLVKQLQPERRSNYNPLCQVCLVQQNFPMPPLEFSGLTLSDVQVASGTAKFDLTLYVSEVDEELAVDIEYNTDLFEAATIARMAGHFANLLQGVVADPDAPIDALPLMELSSLPLTSHGKVDRRALPPVAEMPGERRAYVAPRTAVEAALAAIWCEVLHVEQVGVDDNFFELGGDSILGIQMVARASAQRIRCTALQLFQHQTIAGLAAVVGTANEIPAEQGEVTGPVELTPIEQWFFEQPTPDVHHFNQSLLLEVRQPMDTAHLARAISCLLVHHDALRLRFRQEQGRWRQYLAPAGDEQVFSRVDLSSLAPAEQGTAIESVSAETQRGLNLETGPLLRAVYFDLGPSRPAQLLLVIHHLAVDGVSWRILLEDLHTACRQLGDCPNFRVNENGTVPFDARPQLGQGPQITLPPKTTSLRQWADRLKAYASSSELAKEALFWLSAASAPETSPLPLGEGQGVRATGVSQGTPLNTVASTDSVVQRFDEAPTQALLQKVHGAYHTQINEVLLTALARAYERWSGQDRLLLDLEGHGREDLFAEVDVSRTVGWFTSIFPVMLQGDPSWGPGEWLKSVKEQVRTIPHHGVGYGLLRYLGDEQIARRLAAQPKAAIALNYLGQWSEPLGSDDLLFAILGEGAGFARAAESIRSHVLELSAHVAGGRLQVRWTYSRNLHRREQIERLADAFRQALDELIEHCLDPQSGGYTPCDFPLARISQTALDRLAGSNPDLEDLYPLTPTQEGLLFHALSASDSGVYVVQLGGLLRGKLDVEAFAQAWQRVLDRHPILRTSFCWRDLERPLQVVHRRVPLTLERHDWRQHGPGATESDAERWDAMLHECRHRPFDLSRPPLVRLALIQVADDAYRFVWTHHHLVMDGWSLPLILDEVFACYAAFREGREPALPQARAFRQYVAWLQGQDLGAAESYWRRYLAGFAAPTALGVDHPRGGAAESPHAHQQRQRRLSRPLTQSLTSFARQHQLTLSTLLQGAWSLLLSRYSGDADVVFGAVFSGRPPALQGVETMVGMFVNTLPVRVALPPDESVSAWLGRLQGQLAELRQYEYSPLAEVQRQSDVPRGTPLFESLLVFENYPIDASLVSAPGDLPRVEDLRPEEQTHYPLTLTVNPGDELLLRLGYDRARFDDAAIERLFEHLETVLAQIAAEPGRRLSEVSLLAQAERNRVLVEFNATEAEYPKGLCVHQLIESQAEQTPDAIAVQFDDRRLTYDQLNRQANQLAHHLRALGVGPDVPVGVFLQRSLDMVVGLLGTVKAGGAYLPLDPAFPQDRLAFMLDEAKAPVLLTQASLAGEFGERSPKIVCLDADRDRLAGHDDRNPACLAAPESLAYVIYTSGSTGRPKGVQIPHRALVNFLASMQREPGIDAHDVLLAVTTLSFDIAALELYLPLTVGARVVLTSRETAADGKRLAEELSRCGATMMQATPTTWRLLVQAGWQGGASFRALVGGDALDKELAGELLRRCGAVWNLYGPTETTVWSTACRIEPGCERISIGRPIANTQAYVLDGRLEPVPVGVPGELYIGGDGVARGYLNRPELTAERFVADPFSTARLYQTGDRCHWLADGTLEFLGRVDYQVKVRGFRVELGEIETSLREHPGVREAAVLARDDSPGEKDLVSYLIASGEAKPTVSELRTFLKAKLPEYMVPSHFVFLEQMPRTPNGKLDRRALPAPDSARPELARPYVAPTTLTEQWLAGIWGEVLGVERVGTDDNFFDLGGYSIKALTVAAKLAQAGYELAPELLFEYATIAQLAALLEARGMTKHE